MEIASQGPKQLELISLQMAKGQMQQEGAATLELLDSAAQSAPQQSSTPGAAVGSIINTTA